MDDASDTRSVPESPQGIPDGSPRVSPTPVGEGGAAGQPVRLGAAPLRDPDATGAWLHIVSAATVPLLSRAVFELSARFLAGGHRVLLVDGSPRLRLHDRFDRESRWGVAECLGGMPVLGLVQDTGRLGLYVLAHGSPDGDPQWSRIGALLAEARPHFGRAVLALDPDAPAVVGEALQGLHLEGWWPQWEREARRAAGTGGRLGIPFGDLSLDHLLVPQLEALDARLWQLVAPAPAEAPSAPETPRAPEAVAPDSREMTSDPRARERLRFLLWMRRVEAESTRPAGTPTSSADARPT